VFSDPQQPPLVATQLAAGSWQGKALRPSLPGSMEKAVSFDEKFRVNAFNYHIISIYSFIPRLYVRMFYILT
jgi:hypothetical protein